MCLAIPGKVKKKRKEDAWIDFGGGVVKKVKISLTPQVKRGDYVVVHAGYVIQKMEKEEARETIELFNNLKLNEKKYR